MGGSRREGGISGWDGETRHEYFITFSLYNPPFLFPGVPPPPFFLSIMLVAKMPIAAIAAHSLTSFATLRHALIFHPIHLCRDRRHLSRWSRLPSAAGSGSLW